MDNFTQEPFVAEDKDGNKMEMESYYAFAHPELYPYRGNRLKVMKGEYGLYRTLNYIGISRAGNSVNANNRVEVGPDHSGFYDDYFYQIPYNVQLTDRLWEKTADEAVKKSGYFMYVDASEFPGVITKIPISGLCPNTSLIVNAWVCDVSRNTSDQNRVPANIGFTLKGKNKNNGTETILAKFYSGALTPKPSGRNSTGNAQWQQVSFKFSFSDTNIATSDEFLLEISSNCEGSNGADFGIDEISVFKTLPAINAQRKDACESSVLTVSTDYQTLQSNMSWDIDANVIDESELSDSRYRKYRYGLMGDDPYAPVGEVLHSNVGNVYFSFTEINGNGGVGNWVVLNKNLLDYDHIAEMGLQYAMRVAVQTDMNAVGTQNMIPIGQDEALKDEIIMNVRAMNDFLEDIKRGNWKTEGETDIKNENRQIVAELISNFCTLEKSTAAEASGKDNPLKIKEGSIKTSEIIGNVDGLGDKYEKAVRALYLCLEIPRIRCPWRSEDNTMLYLSEINVHNTDLRFAGEIYEDNVGKKTAKGEYYVVLFSARQIADGNNLDLNSECALKKRIYVMPSTTIAVETQTYDNLIACAGTIQSVNANLQVAEVDAVGNIISSEMKPFDEVFKGAEYTFDWFLGSEEDFQAICSDLNIQEIELADLQGIIKGLRDGLGNDKSVEAFDVNDVETSSLLDENSKKLLKRLLGDGGTDLMLTSGKGQINFRFVKQVFAMPYIPEIPISDGEQDSEGRYWSFCAEGDFITLTENENVPILNVGIPTVSYPTTDFELNRVPLRLGLENIKSGTELRIPIQKEIEFGAITEGESSIHILKEYPDKNEVHLNISGLPVVGTLESLYAEDGSEDNNLILTFNENTENNFKEGETYSLSIPFGEYIKGESGAPDDFIESACEGTANLVIKIVPEYLTWQGDGSAVWYNDDNWNQSTKGELYFDQGETVGTSTADANGSDPDLTKAFAPLYFTKITLLEGKELTLENSDDKTNWGNIQYDMAVNNTGDNGSIEVVPYYINKVDQIYFKPGATLLKQHLLTYNKARVDFEMTKERPYWMSSPLKDVYAGDMYAPAGNGRQKTPAFEDITYDDGTNSRWGLPFYQKAWNKTVWYKPSNDAEAADVEVPLVQSNWSIEYNDVWVPYSVGKGFYSRVESDKDNINNVLVRLPKDDSEYGYETTKALSTKPESRPNSGKLHTDGTTGGNIELNLSSSVDGDGDHFLIGNPYMAYLNMFGSDDNKKGFLTVNSASLAQKYWVLNDGTASVGTPDVDWEWEENKQLGYIAPMQAFFVERKGYSATGTQADEGAANTDLTVTFSIDMTVANPTSKEGETTTRAFKATNPQLTILAKGAEGKSVSFVVQSDFAENVYKSDEDAVALLDSELKIPMVYTVAGNCAAAVNKVKDMQNIPLGVYAEEDEEVEVTIEGMSQFVDSLYLHDALTGKSVLLDGDIYTLRVNGENHGRYTITTKGGITVESNICVYSPSSNNLMIAASPSETLEQVRVFDMSGRMVENRVDLGSSNCRLRIASGIYIVYAKTEAGETKVKVRVK